MKMNKIFWLLSLLILLVKTSEGQEVSGIYTLPIFEVSQTDTTIIGVREITDVNSVGFAPGLEFGVYLNNPFQREKTIEQISLHLREASRVIDGISVSIYEVKYDTIPIKKLYSKYIPC